MKNFLFFLLLIICSSSAWAGIYELSATYNYKKTSYDSLTYEESESGTGSIAYYFWGLSGMEFSFTRGASRLTQQQYDVYQDLTGYGANLLFTIANPQSSFKPYLKVGAAYVIKNIRYFWKSVSSLGPPFTSSGIAPGLGLGFKISLGQHFEFKTGVDASTSPLNNSNSVTYDFGLNAGLGYIF